jgi:hypothetical protein
MKKVLFMAVLMMGFAAVANAQVDGKAIGLRLGNSAEISYWHPMGDANRIEADLGWTGGINNIGGFYAHGVYHWVKDLSELADGFNWYYGGGVGLGLSTGLSVGIVGQIGIEYNFELKDWPLVASIDYRPGLYLINPLPVWLKPTDLTVGIRYKF